MQLQKQVHVPERNAYLSVDTQAWQRIHRQVFWLADGRRDTQRIATLLHKPLPLVETVISELRQVDCIRLRSERKVLVMNKTLLKESFAMIAPYKEAFARSFYERLFEEYPETRALFARTDMRRQQGALMATLATVVAGVERGENLTPVLQHLGSKHKKYGAKTEHYTLVGAVLLETLHDYLGSRFTPEIQEAWEEAYEIISLQMIEGASILTQ
ncbi:MAG: hypothetical protein IMW89_14550 [Ktedonobacteraceae bacterium]|nr:hypothetical protein [Ktedonobacteraceae bacterium]